MGALSSDSDSLPLSAGLDALCRAQRAATPEAAVRGACRYLLAAAGASRPPVPLKRVLKALDIEHRQKPGFRPSGQTNATLQQKGGRLVVYVHPSEVRRDFRRERFLIAHEAVHALILRMLGDGDLIASLEATEADHARLERVCNVGAAELLMPARDVRDVVRHYGVGPQGMLQLYDLFLVTREAVLRRIPDAVPHTAALRWREVARHAGEARRYRVTRCWPGYERGGTRPWLPTGMTTKHLSRDIVAEAGGTGHARYDPDLAVEVGGRTMRCHAVATFFPRRDSVQNRPTLDGFLVPDERVTGGSREVIMLLSNATMATSPWPVPEAFDGLVSPSISI